MLVDAWVAFPGNVKKQGDECLKWFKKGSENVYSFKKSDIKSIITVNKQISIPTWNKEEGLRSEKFKPYKLTRNNVGNIFFKPFYILKIEKDGQSFGICFPPYELNEIERLTGLTATANIGE